MTLGLGDVDFGYICAGCHLFIHYCQCHECEGFDQGAAEPYFGIGGNKMDKTGSPSHVQVGPWVEWIGTGELPSESGRYHTMYKLTEEYLLHSIIEWDVETQTWDVPNSENVWFWSPNAF